MTDRRTTRVRRRIVVGAAALGAAAMLGALVPVPAEAGTSPTPRKLVTGWGYFSSTTSSALTSLQDNAALYSDISPFWYSATWNGSSSAIAPASYAANRASVLPMIKATGVAVLPTITDGMAAHRMAAVLAGTTTRTALVNQIVATVLAESYDGIDLDFEGFAFSDGSSTWASTRPNWVAFVKQLSAGLHAKGKLLSITTPPLYTPTTGYWVYDWRSIGAYVDRLRIMTYDYSTSKAGPISPFAWVSKVVAFAVTQVPSGKIQIGVPNYGRDWVTSTTYSGVTGKCPASSPAGSTTAQATVFADALAYAAARHVITSSGAASYIAKWSGPSFTAPGIKLVTRPVAAWNATYKERTFTTKVSFTGTRAQSVATTGTAPAGAVLLAVPSTTGLVAGLGVTGTGIAPNTRVSAVNATTKVVSLSAATTAAIKGGAVVFAGSVAASCTVNRLAYYDDASSALARAQLVGTYHLRGITEWTIGSEDSAQWSKLRSYATSIAPTPTVVGVTAPRYAPYGVPITVVVHATSAGLPVEGATARLFWRRNGTTAWLAAGSVKTSPTGRAAFTPAVTSGGTFLAIVASSFDRTPGSAATSVAAKSAVSVTAPSAAVRPGVAVVLTARAKPVHAGQVTTLQVRTGSRWSTVATRKADRYGRAIFTVVSPAAGATRQYRVVAAGFRGVAGAYGYATVRSA